MLNTIDISKANSKVIRYKQNKEAFLKHIKDAQVTKSHAQWSDQFWVEVMRIEPFNTIILNPHLVSSFSITYDGLEAEHIPMGSGSMYVFGDMTPLKLDIVFEEEATWDDLYNYFFISDNKPIIPSDGTYLLPKDWYFEIQVYAVDSGWHKKSIYHNNFIIDGSMQKDFNTEGGQIQEITLSFVPMNSNERKFEKNKSKSNTKKNIWDRFTDILF